MVKKLRVYAGNEHENIAQKPEGHLGGKIRWQRKLKI